MAKGVGYRGFVPILDPDLDVLMDYGVPLEELLFIPGGLVTLNRGGRVLEFSTLPPILLLLGTKGPNYTLRGILANQVQIPKASWVPSKFMDVPRNLTDP